MRSPYLTSLWPRLFTSLTQKMSEVLSERTARKKDWRRTIGMFDGDPIMQEIIEEGRRLREEDRRQGRA
jgi:hypothetical protein